VNTNFEQYFVIEYVDKDGRWVAEFASYFIGDIIGKLYGIPGNPFSLRVDVIYRVG
jgi:hypothetical protein